MASTHFIAAAVAALSIASGAEAANFLPTGSQNDIAYDTVVNTWGWTEHYRGSYGETGNLSSVLGGGAYVMLGALNVETNTFDVLAAALRTDVETFTGLNETHAANGSLWYWNPTASIGFAGLGDTIDQNPGYDLAGPTERDRLSWNTGYIPGVLHLLKPGGRSGDQLGLNDSRYLRVVLTADSIDAPVPEPATWALLILGFGAAGASLRRRAASQRPTFVR